MCLLEDAEKKLASLNRQKGLEDEIAKLEELIKKLKSPERMKKHPNRPKKIVNMINWHAFWK
ncbi:37882_t:CDS:2, partial [Gigaspora margarita]